MQLAFLERAGFDGVVDAACIAVCGPVENEDFMCGPVLPEQPPTTWAACAKDVTTGALEGRVLRACLVNDFIAVGLGIPGELELSSAAPPCRHSHHATTATMPPQPLCHHSHHATTATDNNDYRNNDNDSEHLHLHHHLHHHHHHISTSI
jgi:hypothetical protein